MSKSYKYPIITIIIAKITSRSSTAKPYRHPAVASDPSHPLQRRHPRWSACLALEHWCRGLPPQAQHGPGRAPRKLSCSQKEEREVPTHPASQAVAQQSHATTQLWLPTRRYPSSAVTHDGRPAWRNPETQLCERCKCPCRPLTSQVFGSPPGGKLSGAVGPQHVTAEVFDRDFCLPRRGLFPVLQLRRLPNPPPKPSMAQEEAPPRAGELAGENAPGCPPPPRR